MNDSKNIKDIKDMNASKDKLEEQFYECFKTFRAERYVASKASNNPGADARLNIYKVETSYFLNWITYVRGTCALVLTYLIYREAGIFTATFALLMFMEGECQFYINSIIKAGLFELRDSMRDVIKIDRERRQQILNNLDEVGCPKDKVIDGL